MLTPKTQITLTNGQTARVLQLLGQGGQGAVYSVDLNGQKMALKWYTHPAYTTNANFYHNLETNIRIGSPSPAFLWPMYLTQVQHGSFGYIMPLRPKQYVDFSSFLLAKERFRSFQALFSAAINICNAFKSLHSKGLSYQDLNDGNFFLDPKTGDVLICDNDNVIFHGANLGVAGKTRYMAPEVVAGELPNTYTDRFSLTVVLFLLLYGNHPFEGERVLAQPCMRESDEKRFFGSEMVFIYHPTNAANRPVHGIHANVIRRWPALPAALRNQFIEEFSHDKLYANPQSRLIEAEWVRLLQSIKDHIAVCPYCHQETFLTDENTARCVSCGTLLQVKAHLSVESHTLPLIAGNRYQLADGIDFETVLSSTDNLLWLRNIGKSTWQVTTTKGEQRTLAPKALMPAKPGIKIQFNNNQTAEIK
jgi:DNA-binding helix-hairpin-helix protein with protein kinase domain